MEAKERGNALMSKGDIQGALKEYQQGLASVSSNQKDLQVALLLNKALCEYKLNQPLISESTCSQVLELSPGNPKALYRRAQARIHLDKLMEAAKDAKTLQNLQPQSSAAIELLKEINIKARTAESGARKLVTEALHPGASPDLIKKLLTAAHEDESRAVEMASKGGTLALLKHGLEVDPHALSLVSKLASIHATQIPVLDALKSDPSFYSQLVSKALNPDMDPNRAASALGILSRAAMARDRLKISPLSQQDTDPTPFIHALSSPHQPVREVAVDACAQIFSINVDRAMLFIQNDGIEALSSVARTEPQLVSMVLGRILARLTERSKDNDELALERCARLCSDAFRDTSNEIETGETLAKTRAGLNCVLAVMQANAELGAELVMKWPNGPKTLANLALKSPDATVTIAAEIMAQLANTEKGRAALGDSDLSAAMHKLLEHSVPGVRASASVALTKTQAIHFDCDTEQGLMVLSSLATLLGKDATSEEMKRGLEAVSYVIADTDVKMMMTTGPEGTRILRALCDSAREKNLKLNGESALALSFILANLTMDEDEKKREKLREMEVTQEQWERFEEMTKQKSRPGNSRKDSPEEVAIRCDAVVAAGGVAALRSLIMSKNGTLNVAMNVAKALSNMAQNQRMRGTIISQGGISALLKAHQICVEGQGSDASGTTVRKNIGQRDAAHALARIFITTDPRLLSDAQIMDTIGPLLEQIKYTDDDLVLFECLMALTNLETVGESTKQKVCAMKGLNVLEFAMFSETPMVRRAATECMSNLVPQEPFLDWLARGDKIRLWILLAEDWESDMPTSRAASGCLAMVADYPRIARSIRRFGGVERLSEVVKECPHGEIVHRLVVCLATLEDCEDVGDDVAEKDAENHPGGAAVEKETAPPKWTPVKGPWTKKESELVASAMEDVLEFRVADESFSQAVATARAWKESSTNNRGV